MVCNFTPGRARELPDRRSRRADTTARSSTAIPRSMAGRTSATRGRLGRARTTRRPAVPRVDPRSAAGRLVPQGACHVVIRRALTANSRPAVALTRHRRPREAWPAALADSCDARRQPRRILRRRRGSSEGSARRSRRSRSRGRSRRRPSSCAGRASPAGPGRSYPSRGTTTRSPGCRPSTSQRDRVRLLRLFLQLSQTLREGLAGPFGLSLGQRSPPRGLTRPPCAGAARPPSRVRRRSWLWAR